MPQCRSAVNRKRLLVGCIGDQRHLGHIMAVGDACVFPGFLLPVLTLLFFPKPPTTFLTCFCRGERRKYAGKKSPLNRGSNSQPPGYESDTLTTEPPGRVSPDGNDLPDGIHVNVDFPKLEEFCRRKI